jgi:hypothetical protein
MRLTLLYAKGADDEAIRTRMRASADSIGGLPDEAYDIAVERYEGVIVLKAVYTDTIKIPIRPKAVTHRFEVERAQ